MGYLVVHRVACAGPCTLFLWLGRPLGPNAFCLSLSKPSVQPFRSPKTGPWLARIGILVECRRGLGRNCMGWALYTNLVVWAPPGLGGILSGIPQNLVPAFETAKIWGQCGPQCPLDAFLARLDKIATFLARTLATRLGVLREKMSKKILYCLMFGLTMYQGWTCVESG